MARQTLTKERYINPDVLLARINLAEKSERAEREAAKGEKVRAHSDNQTELYRRIAAASEGDTQDIRRAEEMKELLETEQENLKAELEETEDYNRTLREELGSYL